MKDLKLDVCGDLAIEAGDLVLIDGKAEVLQRILIYLRTEFGEYEWDQTKGLNKFGKIFVKGVTKAEIKNTFKKCVERIEGVYRVTEVTIVEYDINLRKISVQLDIVLNEDLEETTLEFTGILPDDNTCETDYLYPYNLGNLLSWFDAQFEDNMNNRAFPGSYSFEGTTKIVGNSPG